MEFVIISLTENRVIEGDESGFNDWGFAVVASVGEFLLSVGFHKLDSRHGSQGDNKVFH
jgi:hypothetical protein